MEWNNEVKVKKSETIIFYYFLSIISMLCLYYNMYSITIGRRVSIKNRDYFLIGDGIVFEYIAKPKPQAQAQIIKAFKCLIKYKI